MWVRGEPLKAFVWKSAIWVNFAVNLSQKFNISSCKHQFTAKASSSGNRMNFSRLHSQSSERSIAIHIMMIISVHIWWRMRTISEQRKTIESPATLSFQFRTFLLLACSHLWLLHRKVSWDIAPIPYSVAACVDKPENSSLSRSIVNVLGLVKWCGMQHLRIEFCV